MAWTNIPQSWIGVGLAAIKSLFQAFKDNLEYLFAASDLYASGGFSNSSFDVDSDADDEPDGWTVNLYAGGAGGLSPSQVLGSDGLNYTCIADHTAAADNKPVTGANWATYWVQQGTEGAAWVTGKAYKALSIHGAKALYFIHPGGAGNGGGYADGDYAACAPGFAYLLAFLLQSSHAGIHNQVVVRYYDETLTYLSSETLFDEQTNNPTAAAVAFEFELTVPAAARYFRPRIHGGVDDVNQAGTIYFDGIHITRVPAVTTAAGSTTFGLLPTARSWNTNNMTMLKKFTIQRAGALRISFEMMAGASSTAYGRIYKNGVAHGTLRSTVSTSYVLFTEDIGGWLPGDTVELWASAYGQPTWVRNFALSIQEYIPSLPLNTLD